MRSYENVSWVISLFELYPSTTQLHTLLPEALSPDEFDVHTPITNVRRQRAAMVIACTAVRKTRLYGRITGWN